MKKKRKKKIKNPLRKIRIWILVSVVLAISFIGFAFRHSSMTGQFTSRIDTLGRREYPTPECPEIQCMGGFKTKEPSEVFINRGRIEIIGKSVNSTDCRDTLIEDLSRVEDYRCEINNIFWDESEDKIKADCICSWTYK